MGVAFANFHRGYLCNVPPRHVGGRWIAPKKATELAETQNPTDAALRAMA